MLIKDVCSYLNKLEEANKIFIKKYPEAKKIYSENLIKKGDYTYE